MKTNFPIQRYLVLTEKDNKVVAILNCPAGEHNLAPQLKKAIEDNNPGYTVNFEGHGVDEFHSQVDFTTRLKDTVFHVFDMDYTLTTIPIY